MEHSNKVSSFGNRAKAGRRQHEVDPSAGVAEMRELCVQFQRAIAALASNDVAELETSTAAQDGLVDKLQGWFRGQALQGQQPSIKVSSSDFRELAHLTRVYSSLLQRALRTTRLRAALCQTYKQNFPASIRAGRCDRLVVRGLNPCPDLTLHLSIAVQALQAEQGALSVTTNNIANVNTPGYSRQVAVLNEAPTFQENGITFGGGVTLQQFQSVRDRTAAIETLRRDCSNRVIRRPSSTR